MDLYLWSLLLGAVGLGTTALMGLDGSGHHPGSTPHGHAGHGHGHDAHGHAPGHAHPAKFATRSFWTVTSPRYLFSLALGFEDRLAPKIGRWFTTGGKNAPPPEPMPAE